MTRPNFGNAKRFVNKASRREHDLEDGLEKEETYVGYIARQLILLEDFIRRIPPNEYTLFQTTVEHLAEVLEEMEEKWKGESLFQSIVEGQNFKNLVLCAKAIKDRDNKKIMEYLGMTRINFSDQNEVRTVFSNFNLMIRRLWKALEGIHQILSRMERSL